MLAGEDQLCSCWNNETKDVCHVEEIETCSSSGLFSTLLSHNETTKQSEEEEVTSTFTLRANNMSSAGGAAG